MPKPMISIRLDDGTTILKYYDNRNRKKNLHPVHFYTDKQIDNKYKEFRKLFERLSELLKTEQIQYKDYIDLLQSVFNSACSRCDRETQDNVNHLFSELCNLELGNVSDNQKLDIFMRICILAGLIGTENIW